MGAGVAPPGPPLTDNRTVTLSLPVPTALAIRISPLPDKAVKLAGMLSVSGANGWAVPLVAAVPVATLVSVATDEAAERTVMPSRLCAVTVSA